MSDQLEFAIFNDPEAGGGPAQAPGTFIQAELDKRGWSQADLAKILGRPLPTVNEIIKGKRGILPEMAVALGSAFGQAAELWMHREAAYRLALIKAAPDPDTARKAQLYDQAPIKEMQKRGWISAKASSADDLEKELSSFWVDDIRAVARKSSALTDFSNAQVAWLCRATSLAKRINARPFSLSKLEKALPKLRKLAGTPERAAHLPIFLAEVGVRFVIVEQLPRTLIDGAAFHLENNKNKPVIALTLRIDRMESVWHTIGHELFHVLNEDPLSLDADLVGKNASLQVEKMEARANDLASNWLIPKDELESFIRRSSPRFSKSQIIQFSNRVGIHPSVVVGQLHYRQELGWNQRNDLCPKIKTHFLETSMVDGHGLKKI